MTSLSVQSLPSRARRRESRLIIVAAAMLAVFAGSTRSLRAQLVFDDFNDGNDAGWAHYDPVGLIVASVTGTYVPFASWTLANGTYRIQASPSPSPGQTGPTRSGSLRSQVYTNFFITADVVAWNPALEQDFGILARVQQAGPGSTDGYGFTWGPNSSLTNGAVDISLITDEVANGISLTGSDTLFLVPGHSYRFVFIGRGPNLEGRVYELPNTNTPLVTVSGVDTTYESGVSGFVIYNGDNLAADATFDNFFSTDIEPPSLTLVPLEFFEYAIDWPLDAVAYKLQSTGALGGTWTDISPSEIQPVGNNFRYYLPSPLGLAPTTFYRLFRP